MMMIFVLLLVFSLIQTMSAMLLEWSKNIAVIFFQVLSSPLVDLWLRSTIFVLMNIPSSIACH